MEILYDSYEPSVYWTAEGRWISPGLYDSYEEFMEAVGEGAEFGDSDRLPDIFHSQDSFSEEAWAYCRAYYEEKMPCDVLEAFVEAYGVDHYTDPDDYAEKCGDAYIGEFDDAEDFGYFMAWELGLLSGIPEEVVRYFDYEAYGSDLLWENTERDGHYFRDDWY